MERRGKKAQQAGIGAARQVQRHVKGVAGGKEAGGRGHRRERQAVELMRAHTRSAASARAASDSD